MKLITYEITYEMESHMKILHDYIYVIMKYEIITYYIYENYI